MAVGDTVQGFSAANADLLFQPAATVSVIILSAHSSANPALLYDGANTAQVNNNKLQGMSQKMIITNTYYIRLQAEGAGSYSGFTGIQIK
jgi:hypothetical protein